MCRWLAYTGSPVLLSQVLYTPVHSLIDQSLRSRLEAETTNGDGFGIGWYDAAPAPRVFRSIEPAWNDQNLRELASHVSSPLFFRHVRAVIGSPVQQTNCHPFRHSRWLFMHNGYIDGFATIKRDLVLAVGESLLPEISGTTDTEALFYLVGLGNTIRVPLRQSGGDVVLAGESAEDLLPADPVLGEVDCFRRVGVGLSWGELAEGTVRPGIVIVQQVFGQHPSQVVLADDQHPVQKLPAQGADHPFADRVRSGCLRRAGQDPDALGEERSVERAGELARSIPDQELG